MNMIPQNTPNKKALLKKIRKLKQMYDSDLIPKLHLHEVNPGLPKDARINYLYFTLPVSINFQRSSPAMWKAALETFNDPEKRYLFHPEKVVGTPRAQIQEHLLKHRLGLQKNKHTDVWIKLCQTFHLNYQNDPREFLQKFKYDVSQIVPAVRKELKKDFPFLSGAKMSNYWLYILHNFTDVKLLNLNEISIIPDTHVIQCTQVLGLSNRTENPDKVAMLWKDLLQGTDLIPIDLHPILWNWSRAGFKPEVA